LSKASSSRHWR